jgi:hypothetical protein
MEKYKWKNEDRNKGGRKMLKGDIRQPCWAGKLRNKDGPRSHERRCGRCM